jgi:hypothetical protein
MELFFHLNPILGITICFDFKGDLKRVIFVNIIIFEAINLQTQINMIFILHWNIQICADLACLSHRVFISDVIEDFLGHSLLGL